MEWAVQPPGSCRATVPVDATISKTLPSPLNLAAMRICVYVFPVPARASIMYALPSLVLTEFTTLE